MMRALRPDRMSYAMIDFVAEMLGTKYVESKFSPLEFLNNNYISDWLVLLGVMGFLS